MALLYGHSGGLTRDEQRARKENWVTALDAIVNKEMARERRCRAWFIRSFKGVMWHAVGNWLSLKGPTRETERGRQRRECVCLGVSSIPYTHAGTHFLHMQLYKYIPGSSKTFYIPTGKNSHHSPPDHINCPVPLPLNRAQSVLTTTSTGTVVNNGSYLSLHMAVMRLCLLTKDS